MTPDTPIWLAVKTRQEAAALRQLAPLCEETFSPRESVRTPSGRTRSRSLIPHVIFIRTTRDRALALEAQSRSADAAGAPLWIYRHPGSDDIREISPRQIDLLRLLTADDATRCRIYTPRSFTPGERVRVTAGIYAGYEGYVKRVERNRHVIVAIEGICMILLPYIHPDLLTPIKD